jgi:malate permease and related proteins
MPATLRVMANLAAIALLFLAGVLLRRMGWLEARHAAHLLWVVVNVGLPALIMGTLSRVRIDAALLVLPAIASLVMMIAGTSARAAARLLNGPRPTEGALVVSAMAMNLAFVFPFVLLAWGPEALARTVIFDIGNSVTQWTLVYFVAARYGGGVAHVRAALLRVALAPPFVAILAAIAVNRLASPVWPSIFDALRLLGQTLTLLVVLAVGLLFEARRLATPEVLAAVSLRCGLGLAAGTLLSYAFGLDRSLAAVAIVGCAAPVGFGAVVMAQRERLDLGLAAAAVSLSGLVALLLLPALLLGLRS